MFQRSNFRFFSALATFLVLAYCIAKPSEVTAEDPLIAPTIKIQYTHIQPNVDALPNPGLPLNLTIQMNRDVLSVGMKVRAIVSRDGVMTEIQDQEPRVDAMEKIYYDMEVPSPMAELSYQFVFSDKRGNAVTTRRYTLARKCLPSVTGSVVVPSGQTSVSKDDARQLKEFTDRLDEEIQIYERASSLLAQIQESIDKK